MILERFRKPNPSVFGTSFVVKLIMKMKTAKAQNYCKNQQNDRITLEHDKNKRKTRRGNGRKNRINNNKFRIIGTNADGILSKKESFLNLIKNENPSCFMVQETKLKSTGQLKVKGY